MNPCYGHASHFRHVLGRDESFLIKEGAKDYMLPSVDRWENLKINAALEEIANATTKTSSQPDRNLIIHVDDFLLTGSSRKSSINSRTK